MKKLIEIIIKFLNYLHNISNKYSIDLNTKKKIIRLKEYFLRIFFILEKILRINPGVFNKIIFFWKDVSLFLEAFCI